MRTPVKGYYALLLTLFLGGCAPFSYALKMPPPKPTFEDVPPPLPRPVLRPQDCPRFVLDTSWRFESWSPDIPVQDLSTHAIEVDDPHPAAPIGLANCKHVAIAPGWWVTAKAAMLRYPYARAGQIALQLYIDKAWETMSSEQKRLAGLGKMMAMDRWRMLAVGTGIGVALTLSVMLTILLGTR